MVDVSSRVIGVTRSGMTMRRYQLCDSCGPYRGRVID